MSTLFKGHPNLIQGFNTFLPPGYRIECSLDPSDPNPIRVTTPTGTTTRPNLASSYSQRWGNSAEPILDETPQPHQLPQFGHDNQQAQHQPALGHDQNNNGSQIEFNHAISYVNKIKTRFANQPDIYKQFLEILQTYQREQKPIGEVYDQVTILFANSPDLLDDFKQFLPDTSNQAYIQQQQQNQQAELQQANQFPQPPSQDGYYANGGSQLPPVGNFQPQSAKSIDGQVQFQNQQNFQIPQADLDQNDLRKKKGSVSEEYNYDNNYNQEAQYSSLRGSQPKKLGTPSISKNGSVPPVTNPTLVPGIPEPVPPSATVKSSSLSEEIIFFDKVKKAIGNKQTYNEFLKMLNLFSLDIIDKATLVERVESFIGDGHPELINWFKIFVGYEDKPQSIENITFRKHQLELSLCKSYGPSYRQLPKAETYMPCSGRDEMCWEVLNDEWVGHPTWASEDSGFIAHRKNQYEEILFKIEEERLDFDYHMEANLKTIQTLETIANRIANMTPEQKANFKLPQGLGHNSTTIYKKVIRKIYDKDRGFEVIDALHENPAVAVPVVLKRLKQKDEEWKRSQREWNKVWREMEQKVFYKSLDHLGLTFKQADKKSLTAKQLVSEISTVKVEQQNKRLHPLTPKPQEQLSYKFTDFDVLYDILRLAEVFIFRSSNYSANDREKLSAFFKYFVSLFFNIPSDEVEKALASRSKKDASTNEKAIEETSANGTDAPVENGSSEEHHPSKKRQREHDLLRDVLKKQSKSRKDERAESPQASSESEDQDLIDEVEKSSELWIKTSNSNFTLKSEVAKDEKRDKYNLFCNTTIYVFFRHLRTLYERLEEIKGMNEDVGKEIRQRKVPQFAKDLNLLSHQLEDMGIQFVGNKSCYQQLLDLSEKLMEGDVEHQWFEESLRQAYKNKAYKIYTVDKVVQALVKHMHSMITDSKTSDMIVLYETDRTNPTSTAKDQILYRMQVRSLMSNDENMFKITYNNAETSVNIQFVSLDDLTINDHENAEERYSYYVTSYVMSHPTEGVSASKINMPFSKTFIESVDEDSCEGRFSTGLKVSICENSYRLFFEKDSHDEFTSNNVYTKQREDPKTREEKVDHLNKLINSDEFGWKLGLEEGQSPEKLDEKINLLFNEGAQSFKSFQQTVEDVEMKDANNTIEDKKEEPQPEPKAAEVKEEKEEEKADASTSKKNPDATIDADTTVAQEVNDTTIQQDGNDTTADDTTVNQEDTIVGDGHNQDPSNEPATESKQN